MNEQEYSDFGKQKFGTVSASKLERIRKYAGRSILDVGCGAGLYIKALKDLGYHVSGVEGNQVLFEEAKKSNNEVYCLDLDSEGLRVFKEGSFDTVLMLDILEHLKEDARLLREAFRVCRKNIILTVPAKMPAGFSQTQFVFGAYVDPTHLRYYEYSDLQKLMKEAGAEHYEITASLRFEPIIHQIFPWYFRYPFSWVNRILLKCFGSKFFATVWFCTATKPGGHKNG